MKQRVKWDEKGEAEVGETAVREIERKGGKDRLWCNYIKLPPPPPPACPA